MKKYWLVAVVIGVFVTLVVIGRSFGSIAETQEVDTDVLATKEILTPDVEQYEPVEFVDGTYTHKVIYEAPYGHLEPMEVSVTIEYGVITDASVSMEASNFTSEEYQDWFQEYYKDEVVGQVLEAVSLSRVGGASLTNKAFDTALERVKQEASGQPVSDEELFVPLELPGLGNSDATYTDGTYTIEDEYYVIPGLSEPMRTRVTLEGGVIVDTEVAFATRDVHSAYHQKDFVEVYKDEVIGKSLGDVPFSRIGGASLTTQGFNDALQQVMVQAKES